MGKIALAAMILGMAGVLGARSMDGDGASKATGETTVAWGTSQGGKGQEEKTRKGEEQTDTSGTGKSIAGIVFQENQFFELMSAGYETATKGPGYEIQLSSVADNQMKEIELVNTYTARGVASIAISPLSATISPEVLKVSSDKEVETCMASTAMDSYPFSIVAYTSDNYAFYKQTGEIAVDFIKKKYEGEKIELGILQFKTQIPEASAERVSSFFVALDEGEVNYEVVSNQDAQLQDTAIARTEDVLTASPDVDIMFAANDGGTIGTTIAVENAGQAGKAFVFGTDAPEQIVNLLKADNDILQVVTGQNPFQVEYKTVEILVQSIEGKDVADQEKTVIMEGIPLRRDDTKQLDDFISDLRSKMQLSSLPVRIRNTS